MNRRQFLQRFAAVPIAAALVEPVTRTIFLPPRGGWRLSRYFTSNTAWFLKKQDRDGIPLFNRAHPVSEFSNVLTEESVLSEKSLEEMLLEIRKNSNFVLRPTSILVTKQEYDRWVLYGTGLT